MAPSALRSVSSLCGLLVLLGTMLAPAAASAEGPGYGGTADAVTVQWEADAEGTGELAVYAVGFQGGSPVALRFGTATELTVYADGAGALKVRVVSRVDVAAAAPTAGMVVLPVDTGSAGRLSPGMSVQIIGRDPAGGIRTLVGAVPPPAAGNGVQDAVPWLVMIAMLVAVPVGTGLLTRVVLPSGLRLAVRRYQHPARHRAGLHPVEVSRPA